MGHVNPENELNDKKRTILKIVHANINVICIQPFLSPSWKNTSLFFTKDSTFFKFEPARVLNFSTFFLDSKLPINGDFLNALDEVDKTICRRMTATSYCLNNGGEDNSTGAPF
ncbi:hypothetical protein BDZ97DRAFT_1839130 [Flammula alnicola]|nr:hypothetical protein BDZ97DRAFT_1839130 [Flammula alnicola]